MPSLGWLGSQALQMEEYDDAAIIYKTMAKLSISPVNKNKYYNLTAACYIEKKDINNIIKYFEKAENADQTHFNPESGMLTDLYIIKGEKEKIQTREDKYKLNALNSDWQGAIIELNSKISNPKNGTAIDGEIYAPADLYLARAIAYRNIGKTEDAKKDLQNALKLSSPNQADYINSAFNNYKNYYKEYYNQIKTTLEVK